MKAWHALKAGDLVDLVAPGYPAQLDLVEKGTRILESWGLRVRHPQDLIRPYHFHAQTDEKRFEFLYRALRAQDSRAVWCVRGGYGACRLVPSLLKKAVPSQPKLFIGISDNTTLHFLLNQKWKWTSLHGPIVERLGADTLPQEIVEETRQMVFGEVAVAAYRDLQPLNARAKAKKKVEGILVGGNLTTMQALLATDLHPSLKDKILFLEDIGERGYRVDRMLEHFVQAGLFENCRAVVFGHFLGGNEPSQPDFSHVPFALQRFAEKIRIPVFQGLQAGHGDHQRPLPLGAKAILMKNELQVNVGFQ